MNSSQLIINGERIEVANYLRFHRRRIAVTIEALRALQSRRIVELGGHPWVMTSLLSDDGAFELAATISAEEITNWPDEIDVTRHDYRMTTLEGREVSFPNYSANIERSRFNLDEQADTVIACEIIEHLVRSPHVMLLNINRWLPIGGKLLLTTPNGAQFSNPLRRKSARPPYRCNVYARHNGALTREQLADLVELCGFAVKECRLLSPYQRNGASRVYSAVGAIPLPYFAEKFGRTIFLIAEKATNVAELPRLPLCYAPSPGWEFVRNPGRSGAALTGEE